MDEDFRNEPSDDREMQTSINILDEEQAEGPEITELRKKLKAAEDAYRLARQDVDHPTWGRWAKYMFVTASGKASSAETATFVGARAGLVYTLGNAAFAIGYLVPAILYSKVQSLDNASSNTTDTTKLADEANVAYYWANATGYGWQALTGIAVSLTSIASYYKAMRERVLEEAAAERDRLQEKLDRRQGLEEELRIEKGKHKLLVESYYRMEYEAEQATGERDTVQREAKKLQVRLEKTESRLEKSDEAVSRLQDDLSKASERAASTEEKRKALRSELKQANLGIKQRDLALQALTEENRAAEIKIKVLESSVKELEEREKKAVLASRQIKEVETKANTLNKGSDDKY